MMIEPSLASKLEAPCLLSVVVPVFNEEAVLPVAPREIHRPVAR